MLTKAQKEALKLNIEAIKHKAALEEREKIVRYLGQAGLSFRDDGDQDGFSTCAAMAMQIKSGAHDEEA